MKTRTFLNFYSIYNHSHITELQLTRCFNFLCGRWATY